MKKTALLLAIIFVVSLAACAKTANVSDGNATTEATEPISVEGTVLDEANVSPAEIISYTKAVLSKYTDAKNDNLGKQTLVDEDLNMMVADCYDCFGYAFQDLDGDGKSELIIGSQGSDNEFYDKMIFELYTLNDAGEVVRVFTSGERNRYYFVGGDKFANVGSSGYDDSYDSTLQYKNGEMVDLKTVTDPANYIQIQYTLF